MFVNPFIDQLQNRNSSSLLWRSIEGVGGGRNNQKKKKKILPVIEGRLGDVHALKFSFL